MYLFKYVMKRLGLMLLTFVVIMVVCFVLIKMLPIVVNAGFGEDANITYLQLAARGYICNLRDQNGNVVTAATITADTIIQKFDTVPVMTQLVTYLNRLFTQGDFGVGVNIQVNRKVWDVFLEKLPPTILINVYSTLIGVPIGLGLGILAALKKNKWQDQLINVAVILLISLPSIVMGLIIQSVFCFRLGWFPITMESLKPGGGYFTWDMFRSMLPAVFSLSLGSIAGYARFTRAELCEVLTNEYMLLARTKGLTRAQATRRHAMRNAMVPIFPSILSEFIAVLSGSLIIESMFSIPGVGGLYLDSITYLDYDFFIFLSGFYTLVGLVAGIVVDVSYGIIDPRIRMGAK